MKSNTAILVGVWILILAFAGFFFFGVSHQIVKGDFSGFFAIVFAVAMMFGIRWWTADKVRRLLQADSAATFIAYYRRALLGRVMIPNGEAMYAHSAAVVHLIYGDFPAARACLHSVNWAGRMPLIEGMGLSGEALLCYFDTRDYEKGLEFAQAAQKLAQTAEVLPGAKTSAAAFASYVEIGEILCRRATPETLASLRERSKRLPLMGKILVAWGLAIGYRDAGNPAQFEVMRNYLRLTAPHCRALRLEDIEPV